MQAHKAGRGRLHLPLTQLTPLLHQELQKVCATCPSSPVSCWITARSSIYISVNTLWKNFWKDKTIFSVSSMIPLQLAFSCSDVSELLSSTGSPTLIVNGGSGAEQGDEEEMCPICRSETFKWRQSASNKGGCHPTVRSSQISHLAAVEIVI